MCWKKEELSMAVKVSKIKKSQYNKNYRAKIKAAAGTAYWKPGMNTKTNAIMESTTSLKKYVEQWRKVNAGLLKKYGLSITSQKNIESTYSSIEDFVETTEKQIRAHVLFYKKYQNKDKSDKALTTNVYSDHIIANLLKEVYDKLPHTTKAEIQTIMQELEPDFSGYHWDETLNGFTNNTFIIKIRTVTKGEYSEDTMSVDILGDVEEVYGA